MKIINYISNIIVSVLLLNNGYTMENKINNKEIDNVINQINNLKLQDNHYDNSDTLVKFHDSNQRCGLASLNQCFSVLIPGNNEFLQKFKKKYYDISRDKTQNTKIFDPKYIFEPLLKNIIFRNSTTERNKNFYNGDIKQFLYGSEGSDVAERYNRLINVLSSTKDNIQDINAFCELRNYNLQSNNINYIKLIHDSFDIGRPVTENTLNLLINNNDITNINFYKQICSNTTLNLNNINFNLSALIFLCVRPDGQINRAGTHFVSAKKLSDGKWRLIDSSHNERNQIYNNFDELMNTYVIPKNLQEKIKNRLMPKLMFFTKSQNTIKDNINTQIKDLNVKIEENKNLIKQIATENKYIKTEEDQSRLFEFLNKTQNDKAIFDKIINLDNSNNKNKDEVYTYFANNNYGWLFDKSIEIITTIFKFTQTYEMFKDALSQIK